MTKVSALPTKPRSAPIGAGEMRPDAIAVAIKQLFFQLPAADRQALLSEMVSTIPAIPAPRAGELLGTMAKILPMKPQWTVPEIREGISAAGVRAKPKEVYNALGYLTRRGYVRRLCYGRYLIDGALLITAEDLGGEPARYDDD